MTFEIPKLPTFTTKIPSTGKKVTFRPFTVREESFLLQAKETETEEDILTAVKGVISACVNGIKVDHLSVVDAEWLFLQIRIRSVSEDIEQSYRCLNEVDGKECNGLITSIINLNDVEIKGEPKIVVGFDFPVGKYNLVFKQLPLEAEKAKTKINRMFMQLECIEDPSGKVHSADDIGEEKFNEFVSTFPTPQFQTLEAALSDVAGLYYKDELVCPKCGNKSSVEYKRLVDFFT